MRSSATFQANLANGNYSAIAATLNTLNYVKTATANTTLPDVPGTVRGAVMRYNNFPENFIATSPQYGTANYLSNMSSSNYHSLQTEVTLKPTHGFSGSMNYTWSKNLGLPSATGALTGFTNPVDRRPDYTIVNNNHPHALRTNGVVGRALRFDGSNDRVQATNTAAGNALSSAFSSCRQTTSGVVRSSQPSSNGSRRPMLFTLKVAIFMT